MPSPSIQRAVSSPSSRRLVTNATCHAGWSDVSVSTARLACGYGRSRRYRPSMTAREWNSGNTSPLPSPNQPSQPKS